MYTEQIDEIEEADPASFLVGIIVDKCDTKKVCSLVRSISTILKDENSEDVFTALAIVTADEMLHYDPFDTVAAKSFHLLLKENIRNLDQLMKERPQ